MSRRPAPQPAIRPGDIVAWDGHHWDVLGQRQTGRLAELWLGRLADGARSRELRVWVDRRRVALVGHQGLLPGLSEPEPESSR
jgi:hypothetical protein